MKKLLTILLVLMPLVTRTQTCPSGLTGKWSLKYPDNDEECEVKNMAQPTIFNPPLINAEVFALEKINESIRPYLETPTATSIYIDWHTDSLGTKVIYGTDENTLSFSQNGTYQVIDNKKWHTVKLTGLSPNTTYYYRCISGFDSSYVYTFHTPISPGTEGGHIRFAIISDSQYNTLQSAKTAIAMKEKFIELYGADWYNKVNLIMHTGDIIQGTDIYEYEAEYFTPFSILSSSVPFMISLGNHDYSTISTFNKYMHYEDFSNILSENLYSFKLGNVQFVSTNSSNSLYQNIIQTKWLTQTLENSKNNPDVDFIFTFGHEGISEIWPNGNNLFVSKTIFPILAQYPKVAMYSCGHAHNYENGSYITNNNENKDFRTLIFGGAGGTIDRWGDYSNQTDLRDVHKSFDYYGYTIIDVDVANKSYNATAYSLGNSNVVMYNTILDQWHGVNGRLAPDKPIAAEVQNPENYTTLIASTFKGYENDSIMSSQFQIASLSGNFNSPIVDTIRHWVNYFGINKNYEPVNLNNGIDLTRVNIKNRNLNAGKSYKWRVRYRDHNCKWSLWSDSLTFSILANDILISENYQINPNPAWLNFSINGTDITKVDLLSIDGKCIKQYNLNNSNSYNLSDIKSGLYLLRIYTSKRNIIKKLIVKK